MSIRDWPVAERPREKLLEWGAASLSDAELLAIFLRTGLHSLSDRFSLAELEHLVSDKDALAQAIADLEAELDGPFKDDYIHQASALGYYKATDRVKSTVLMFNAHNIARLAGTASMDRVTEEQAVKAEAVIEMLVSLYALDSANKAQFSGIAQPGTISGQREEARKVIDGFYEKGSWRHETARTAVADYYNNKGIIVKDNKGNPLKDKETGLPIRVLPSTESLGMVLDEVKSHFWRPGGGGDDSVENALKRWEENPENIAAAQKFYNEDAVKKIRAVDKPKTK